MITNFIIYNLISKSEIRDIQLFQLRLMSDFFQGANFFSDRLQSKGQLRNFHSIIDAPEMLNEDSIMRLRQLQSSKGDVDDLFYSAINDIQGQNNKIQFKPNQQQIETEKDSQKYLKKHLIFPYPLQQDNQTPSIAISDNPILSCIDSQEDSNLLKKENLKPIAITQAENETTEMEKKVTKLNNNEKTGDQRKNIAGNSFKEVVKNYISKQYAKRVARIHKNKGITDSQAAKIFYSSQLNWSLGLGDIYRMLNPDIGNQNEKLYKEAFLIFYRWFMRGRYAVHVLKQDKITHKELYLSYKNVLMYLPRLKNLKKRAPRKNKKKSVQIVMPKIESNDFIESRQEQMVFQEVSASEVSSISFYIN